MKMLNPMGQKWLKLIHVFLATTWLAAALSLFLMSIFLKVKSGQMLYGITFSMKFIDDFIIIPAGIGSVVTGIIYSIWTQWGFFKHKWITVKWIIAVGGTISGTFWLGPCLNSLPPVADKTGMDALVNSAFIHNFTMLKIGGFLQVALLFVALYASIFKPWKRTKKASES